MKILEDIVEPISVIREREYQSGFRKGRSTIEALVSNWLKK